MSVTSLYEFSECNLCGSVDKKCNRRIEYSIGDYYNHLRFRVSGFYMAILGRNLLRKK
jgi:hypothetical protein